MRPSPLGEARGSEALSEPIDERGERWVLTVKVERGMLASGTFLGCWKVAPFVSDFFSVFMRVVCVVCLFCLFVFLCKRFFE